MIMIMVNLIKKRVITKVDTNKKWKWKILIMIDLKKFINEIGNLKRKDWEDLINTFAYFKYAKLMIGLINYI